MLNRVLDVQNYEDFKRRLDYFREEGEISVYGYDMDCHRYYTLKYLRENKDKISESLFLQNIRMNIFTTYIMSRYIAFSLGTKKETFDKFIKILKTIFISKIKRGLIDMLKFEDIRIGSTLFYYSNNGGEVSFELVVSSSILENRKGLSARHFIKKFINN